MKKLKSKELRWQCPDEYLKFFKGIDKIPPTDMIVGQDRALGALDLGLKLYRPGYNIYVAGMAGTGRMTTIKRALEQTQQATKAPPDRCYVYNFVDPAQPVLITFPRGQGKTFRDDMRELIRVLRAEIPKTLESPHVTKEKDLIVERYQRQEKKIFEDFAESLKKEGFALIQIQEGGYVAPSIFPIVGEEAVSIDFLDNLVKEGKMSAEERDKRVRKHKELSQELKRVLAKARGLGKELHHALDRLLQRSASIILDGLMDDLRSRYTDEKVVKYLLRVKNHILKNIEIFSGKEKKEEGLIVLGAHRQPEDPFWLYDVNFLYDQSQEGTGEKNTPIVEENNPSYVNLFGAIEYNLSPGGAWTTDFRHIKAGAILKADGGYLIVNALDVLKRPFVWDQLKRVLKTEKLIIQQPEYTMAITPLAVKPEPIELNVKVIMIGSSWIYDILYNWEDEFPKIFKVLSDFDTTMQLSKNSVKQYASVLKTVCERQKLMDFDKEGLAAMLEHGVEESENHDRISTRFAYITDVLREANYWAKDDKAKTITRKYVEKAINARKERHRLTEERVQRLIEEGVIIIDSKGKRAGQINGLSVYSRGHATFGKPSRVTASTSVGKAGLINIEREARLSGPTHDKGVLILSGYLRQKYASTMPLNLSASICFEQSYGGVDGDSASSTELYALLSSLSEVPINQELAVTGSINQMGDIQPIGGVNQKIEGFFDVCKAQGLTGKQCVLIPSQNIRHLMLRKDVVEAVEKKKFHIYAIDNVDEGIEILTGLPAGKRQKDGKYPANTVHGKVKKKLEKMAGILMKFEGSAEGEKPKRLPAYEEIKKRAKTKKKIKRRKRR